MELKTVKDKKSGDKITIKASRFNPEIHEEIRKEEPKKIEAKEEPKKEAENSEEAKKAESSKAEVKEVELPKPKPKGRKKSKK